jgi:hypothetical protein
MSTNKSCSKFMCVTCIKSYNSFFLSHSFPGYLISCRAYIYFRPIHFFHQFIHCPCSAIVCTFQVALCISFILFHCLGMPLSLTVPRPQFRFSNKLTACHPTPNLEGQSTIYILTPGLCGLAIPLGTGHPIWLHGLQWNFSFPRSPHGEILTICGRNRPNAGKIKNTRP